ncbi:porin [Shewanella amazonensis]|uniref:Outer membrane porin, putative n=1 Tax=Shewanella amazonensis (strain ATCC BAA-1098 / SB2B) TaxID=326297 RepID=A1SAN5_SHEAM|nr:porin [Shewanella amazonensis]ABM01442.1 outer membrane porin, putative [Shewanella amazonensis SB2B]
MYKALIALALLAPGSAVLAADADFYGRINLSVTDSDLGVAAQNGKAGTVLENNSSRIGVKGSEAIGEGLEVFYKLEFGVDNFDNSGKTFKPRNTYIGVKTDFGAVSFGRNDSVFKTAEGTVDAFNGLNSDINQLLPGQDRFGDSVTFNSPKLGKLVTLNGTYLVSDNYDSSNAAYAISATLGDAKLKKQDWYLAFAYNDGLKSIESSRVVGQIKLGDLMLGGLYQQSEHQSKSNLDGNSYYANVTYSIGKTDLKLVYGHDDAGLGKYVSNFIKSQTSGSTSQVADVDLNQLSVGVNHKLAKSTQIYGHYTRYDGDLLLDGVNVSLDDDLITLGIRYDF